MQKIKLGILGCGGAALTIHLPILDRLRDKFILAAVCDQCPKRASQTAEKFNINKSCSSLEEMLQVPFDMLVILTLNHEEPIAKGLKAKKHIFTEKPISLDLQQSYLLQKRAEESGLALNVGLMRSYDPLIRKLNEEIEISSIDSGYFYKYDGSDAYFRKLLFQQNMDVYTFQTSPPPQIPSGLNEVQLFVLKTLLWSGIHQLGTMLFLFGKLEPVVCRVDKQQSSITCIFETPLGKQITLHIGSTDLPIYEEKIFLFGKNLKAECSFSSPYLNISQSSLSISKKADKDIVISHANFHVTAFQEMWEGIHQSMNDGKYISPLFALEVEKIASKSALIATSSGERMQ